MRLRLERRLTLPAISQEMPASDLETAQQFQSAAQVALLTGDFGPMEALLAPDVECATPQHTLQGVDALTEELRRARPSESFEVEFEDAGWKHLGNGRYSCEIHAFYRSKVADDLSYSRDRSFELTIRDGKVSRYEMRFAG
jgi:ketosteroid isomerase-like protein